MLLDIRCKTGKIQLTDDGTLRVQSLFGKTLWEAPAVSVTQFTIQPGIISSTVTIYTALGDYQAETVANPNLKKLQECFPAVPSVQAGKEWWHNPIVLTHVATYSSDKEMQRDLEAAYQYGWQIQGQSGTGSHVNVGRSVTKFVLTGGLGLMTGVSRSKDKTTITYVRTQEWLSEHHEG